MIMFFKKIVATGSPVCNVATLVYIALMQDKQGFRFRRWQRQRQRKQMPTYEPL